MENPVIRLQHLAMSTLTPLPPKRNKTANMIALIFKTYHKDKKIIGFYKLKLHGRNETDIQPAIHEFIE